MSRTLNPLSNMKRFPHGRLRQWRRKAESARLRRILRPGR